MTKLRDLTGERFDRLTVVARDGRSGNSAAWRCLCDCGCETVVGTQDLTSGKTRSCGCLRREATSVSRSSHGASRGGVISREYAAWAGMKTRCSNPNRKEFRHYGGRGIKVCDRWVIGDGATHPFECFLADIGPSPGRGYSLGRKDNDGDYRPGNVRWETSRQQMGNTRAVRLVDLYGDMILISEAIARFAAVSAKTVYARLRKGWRLDDAILVPDRGDPSDADCRLWPVTRAAERVTVVQ